MFNSGYLQRPKNAGIQHTIYFEEHGNPNGLPLIVLHGGPGGSINHNWGNFFDKHVWRIIYFDQRGCGKSTPFGETKDNSVEALVGDMEALREHLNIERWSLFGGSWGTTLALIYGVSYPERCMSFLLRGVWLARPEDIDWFVWGAQKFYPREHNDLLSIIESHSGARPENPKELITVMNNLLHSATHNVQLELARAWFAYELHMSAIEPMGLSASEESAEQDVSLSIAKLETHFLRYELPLKTSILDMVAQSPVRDLPCQIVHGHYDMVCPVNEAYALHKIWPESEFHIATASGHYTFEPEIERQLYLAAQKLTLTLTTDK